MKSKYRYRQIIGKRTYEMGLKTSDVHRLLLGAGLDVTLSGVSRWLKGNRDPKVNEFLIACDALGVEPRDLVEKYEVDCEGGKQ